MRPIAPLLSFKHHKNSMTHQLEPVLRGHTHLFIFIYNKNTWTQEEFLIPSRLNSFIMSRFECSSLTAKTLYYYYESIRYRYFNIQMNSEVSKKCDHISKDRPPGLSSQKNNVFL